MPGNPLDGTLYRLPVVGFVRLIVRVEVLLVDDQFDHFRLVRFRGDLRPGGGDFIRAEMVDDEIGANEYKIPPWYPSSNP